MTLTPDSPALPGFNPDPSVVRVDGAYYLVTSSFEYLPGLPVYRSTDLVTWQHLTNIAQRPEQVAVEDVPTPGGVWAPTIRHHDGLFHVIVSVFLGGRGCVVFTAEDAAGPWSDGVVIDAVDGIDPDLAWDDDGTAYISYASFGRGILQVRADLRTGKALEEPRPLWPGTGLLGTEGPHLYHRNDTWYLLVAEGGTDRGHTVSIARSSSPMGPFEGCPQNPILSARSTAHPVQNLGHADLVATPEGGTAMVLLGVRPVDAALGFSPLGRETFVTTVSWVNGWPVAELPAPGKGAPAQRFRANLTDPAVLSDPGWLAVRRTPHSVATIESPGILIVAGDSEITSPRPAFVGRRQRHHNSACFALVNARDGEGGIATRMREDHVVAIQASDDGTRTLVTARAILAGISQSWTTELAPGPVRLSLETEVLPVDLRRGLLGGEVIRLVAEPASESAQDHERVVLAELDGRYWSYETAKGFTGRVTGVFAASGRVRFLEIGYDGLDTAPVPDATLPSRSATLPIKGENSSRGLRRLSRSWGSAAVVIEVEA